ncbi:hypothetical protein HQ393_01740 [Chitinibacter bivalviorum]|uniref:Uncharacterized protein n=1 Tax=Chitinibacter bivalviorum TaxID=2739434 RepID=A0A7H9BFP9_9NEIS|nr:hypothetical protein [Chitinibacter bivalviorum]QLG87066.1 hypothetical protein HQ393_01740 [Chitinibacter bivalviorum]
MANTLDLSQEIAVSYGLTNALTQDYRKNGAVVSVEAALRTALKMLNDDRKSGAAGFNGLAAIEYLSAVVEVIDGKAVRHA